MSPSQEIYGFEYRRTVTLPRSSWQGRMGAVVRPVVRRHGRAPDNDSSGDWTATSHSTIFGDRQLSEHEVLQGVAAVPSRVVLTLNELVSHLIVGLNAWLMDCGDYHLACGFR
jgi:hypothetical protein